MKDYVHVVSELLRRDRYCLLNDSVVLTVFYKTIVPDSDGRYVSERPETAYERALEPFECAYLSRRDGCVYLHAASEVDVDRLPVQCRHVRLARHVVNGHLNRSYRLFEEEIYAFLTYLNYDPTGVAGLMGLSFVDATRLVPVDVRMSVVEEACETRPIVCGGDGRCFGPGDGESHMFQPREIYGRISGATSRARIASLRDGEAWKCEVRPEWALSVSPYVVYYAVRKGGYLPLAFNPFENPIIASLVG